MVRLGSFPRLLLLIGLGFWSCGHARAAEPKPTPAPKSNPVSCPFEKSFEKLQPLFWRRISEQPASPATMMLPGGSTAQLYFHHPLSPSVTFRVFEVYHPLSSPAIDADERDILSVQAPDPDTGSGLFKPSDSVQLQVGIPPRSPSFWPYRDFVILACDGADVATWGFVEARVSDPLVAKIICAIAILAIYFLAMCAVYVSRKADHPLAEKYPAIFGARPLTAFEFLNPIHLTANAFNQASVQKLQVIMFSFLVGSLVLYLVLTTGTLVDLSTTVVELLGISGIGAAAAQATFTQRSRLSFDNWSWLQTKHVIKQSAPAGPQWRDLVLTNREFDIYKLQTIIFSIGVAFEMFFSGSSQLAKFTIPATTLGILGLSQIVYIGGVMVRPPTIAELDDALTKLRAAGEKVASAKIQKTDTDQAGNLLTTPPGPIAENAQRQYDDMAKKVAGMIESALEVEVDRTKL